jgi:hypothetical protein
MGLDWKIWAERFGDSEIRVNSSTCSIESIHKKHSAAVKCETQQIATCFCVVGTWWPGNGFPGHRVQKPSHLSYMNSLPPFPVWVGGSKNIIIKSPSVFTRPHYTREMNARQEGERERELSLLSKLTSCPQISLVQVSGSKLHVVVSSVETQQIATCFCVVGTWWPGNGFPGHRVQKPSHLSFSHLQQVTLHAEGEHPNFSFTRTH